MSNQYGIVYVHISKIDGRAYVGQTTQDPVRRWRKHDLTYNSYRGCPFFLPTLIKHGWSNFDTKILGGAADYLSLNKLEEYYINEYNSMVPNGFNTTGYNNGSASYAPSTRQAISKALTGRKTGKPAPNAIPHNFIDGVEHKYCKSCDKFIDVTNFRLGSDKGRKRLNAYCNPCQSVKDKERRARTPKMDYNRKLEIFRINAKNARDKQKADPSYKRTRSLSYGGYKATSVLTNNVIIYECGHDLKTQGYRMSSICRAIINKSEYKGYKWEKISID